MTDTKRLLSVLVTVLLSALLAAPAAADDDVRTITLVTDEGETYVCNFGDEDNIRMFNGDTGESVFELDLGAIEETIAEAFDEWEEAFEDFELNLRVDDGDNFLRVAADDDEVIVNFDAIIEGVSEAVAALGEMEFVESRHRFRATEGMEELEDELDALRDEMRELKKELAKEKRRARH